MILDYLEKVAVPIILAVAAPFVAYAIKIADRGRHDTDEGEPAPTTPVNVPPPAPEPAAGADKEQVQDWLFGEVRRLLLSEAASTAKSAEQDARAAAQDTRIAQLDEKLTRVTEDYMVLREGAIPLVEWLDAGAPQPHPIVSATVRRLLGIAVPVTAPKWD